MGVEKIILSVTIFSIPMDYRRVRSYALVAFGLQCYASVLAWVQSIGGVLTDEAKYLLNIPYPQPPLVRWVLHLSDGWVAQEWVWRILFATLLVHAAWFVWDAARTLPRRLRLFLCAGWLFAASTVLWGGAIIMSPLTAIQGLLFVWLFFRPEWHQKPLFAFFLGTLWLVSLYTAYQAVLYMPLVFLLLFFHRRSLVDVVVYGCIPIGLVFLYALTNPLILASFVNAGTENTDIPLWWWFYFLLRTLFTGGSIVLSVLGLAGMVRHRHWGFLGSLFLVGFFIFISFRDYYDILFLPLFVGGSILLLQRWQTLPLVPSYAVLVSVTAMTVWLLPPVLSPSTARMVFQRLEETSLSGEILIQGSFGHQWQYESAWPVRKYTPEFLDSAATIICLNPCDQIPNSWRQVPGLSVEVWMSR
ncbi:hypothetical protein COU77_04380 [Candidatus Peregrinibacteria bacterium CG10_big_fil_rev_8_21_14_0_10_49_16]|nr:MAG: hypothetical protein COW95_00195 [Candidatus Peregrinibacteria bacterium CG22_combo_CG10-13_8_21_14_all_49_11]PIR51688.1 MAG: hypothetical protein COU77_04380 [Candidatus Peregrinibacteria bacterium CG10_big_fil_rev_8_21_14_0_10_49_16]